MKRFVYLAALLAILPVLPAAAQVGLYGKFDFASYTDSNSSSSKSMAGAGIGVYYDFVHAGPIALGADVRGDLTSGNQYKYRDLLLGARLTAKVPVAHLRPYIEPLIGIGGARFTGPTGTLSSGAPIVTHYDNKLTYGLVGGFDVTIVPHLDWRVVEVGYTRQSIGALSNPSILVSTGLVFRL
jgi:hypothetical protein